MTDFHYLRNLSENRKQRYSTLLDDFLIYYAATQEKLELEMNQRLGPYRHVWLRMEPSWLRYIKAQYIAHRIFRKNGLLRKYLKHVGLKKISADEREFLEFQLQHPWRFSFARIVSQPAEDFYEMEDILSGESYLLYSHGMSDTRKERPVMLWLNLIAYNGGCWETYGPISAYSSFDEDDIFFFATERNGNLEGEDDIVDDIDKNPMPYFMLYAFSALPLTVSKGEKIVQVIAEHDLDEFSTDNLQNDFMIEYAKEVYSLAPKKWSDPPHMACAYYDEKDHVLMLTAMTGRGFEALAERLIKCGIHISEEPHICVTPSMIVAAEDIFKKKVRLNPYEMLFEMRPSEVDQAETDKINSFIAALLPYVNAGKTPDIDALAKEAGINEATAMQLFELMRKKKGHQ